MARKAFAEDLPEELIQRHSKGVTRTTSSFVCSASVRHSFATCSWTASSSSAACSTAPEWRGISTAAQDGYAEGFSTLLGAHADTEIWLRRWRASQFRWRCTPISSGYSASSPFAVISAARSARRSFPSRIKPIRSAISRARNRSWVAMSTAAPPSR